VRCGHFCFVPVCRLLGLVDGAILEFFLVLTGEWSSGTPHGFLFIFVLFCLALGHWELRGER
jgi:hypothetical protein